MEFNYKELAENDGLLKYLDAFITPRRKELIEKVLAERTRHLTIALEDVSHSPNASATVRSCECFGVQDMYVIENSTRFKANTKVVQGSAKWINLQRFNKQNENNTEACFKHLRQNGYAIAATTLRKEKYTPLSEIPLDKKLALCFGCEESGLSDFAHEQADYFVQLPMYGFTESFNISVSVALVLQALCQRLRDSDIPIVLTEAEKAEIRVRWYQNSMKNFELLTKRYLKHQ